MGSGPAAAALAKARDGRPVATCLYVLWVPPQVGVDVDGARAYFADAVAERGFEPVAVPLVTPYSKGASPEWFVEGYVRPTPTP